MVRAKREDSHVHLDLIRGCDGGVCSELQFNLSWGADSVRREGESGLFDEGIGFVDVGQSEESEGEE